MPVSVVLWALAGQPAVAASFTDAVQQVRAVGPEGQGNAAASAAWKILADEPAASIPRLLAAMDGANDLAVNWLRAAVETIASRGPAAVGALPLSQLESFVRDARHHPRARYVAYELIARASPATASRLLDELLDDPGPDLRHEAVQKIIDEGTRRETAGDKPAAIALYQKALGAARSVGQINVLSDRLKNLGQPVDLPALFGFLMNWQVVGPFDNTEGKGFDAVYPPERGVNLSAEYDGKSGKVRWTNFVSTSPRGVIDLNQPIGALKSVTGYACTKFVADQSRPVEVRLGSENAWKLWLNGQLLFGREEYHRGMEIDQYRVPATLRAGTNSILVKLCQDAPVEDWTKQWDFQLRITDAAGTPIRAANVVAPAPNSQ